MSGVFFTPPWPPERSQAPQTKRVEPMSSLGHASIYSSPSNSTPFAHQPKAASHFGTTILALSKSASTAVAQRRRDQRAVG